MVPPPPGAGPYDGGMTTAGTRRGDMEGRIAVVTGASAGIGRAVAIELAARGAGVVVNGRRAPLLESLVAELPAGRAVPVAGDAAEQGVIDAMLDAARYRLGGGAREADLVVVNAGRGLRGSVYDSDRQQWEEVYRVNLLGAARLMRSAAERMIGPPVTPAPGQAPPPPTPPAVPADWPGSPRDILVLGSTVGRHLSPFSSLYGSAKAGVHMLAESLRRTCGPRGVRVSLLEPGIVRSEFQRVAQYDPVSFGAFMESIAPVLTPEDIARTVAFIAGQPAGVHINDVMIRPTRQEYP